MLASHPRIGVPPEGGFVVQLGWRYGHKRLIRAQQLPTFIEEVVSCNDTMQDWEIDRERLRHELEALVPCLFPTLADAVYRHYLNKNFAGKPRWGDKTTWYLDYLDQLHRYFPNARYLHIVRDGRDVIASFKRTPHLTNDMALATMGWVAGVNRIRWFGRRRGTQFLEIRYENIVTDPETQLRRICEFLGEQYSPEMLQFSKKNRAQTLEPLRHMGWKSLTLQPATPSQVGGWSDTLSPPELAQFWAIARRVMSDLGYGNVAVQSSVGDSARRLLRNLVYDAKGAALRKLRPLSAMIKHARK